MKGSSWDDLSTARRAALDVARGFERWETTRAAAKASESEARQRIARNLHDSVQQVMAGIGLKLRAARTTAPEGEQRDRELWALVEELVVYQQQLSGFIADLREPRATGGQLDLAAALNEIAAGIRRQWSVEVDVHGDPLACIPGLLGDEVAHLLREAAANAVRHGKATKLVLAGEIADDCLLLTVRDNGSGFPEAGNFDHFTLAQNGLGPRSILERVESFRGTVDLVSSDTGATVSILIPLGMVEP
jgi:signal transduction histidine kinase